MKVYDRRKKVDLWISEINYWPKDCTAILEFFNTTNVGYIEFYFKFSNPSLVRVDDYNLNDPKINFRIIGHGINFLTGYALNYIVDENGEKVIQDVWTDTKQLYPVEETRHRIFDGPPRPRWGVDRYDEEITLSLTLEEKPLSLELWTPPTSIDMKPLIVDFDFTKVENSNIQFVWSGFSYVYRIKQYEFDPGDGRDIIITKNNTIKMNYPSDYFGHASIRCVDENGVYSDWVESYPFFVYDASSYIKRCSGLINVYPKPFETYVTISPFLEWNFFTSIEGIKKGDVTFDVYFGESPTTLNVMGTNLTNRILYLPELAREKKYYWKVNANFPDGLYITGEVCSFTTAPPHIRDYECYNPIPENNGVLFAGDPSAFIKFDWSIINKYLKTMYYDLHIYHNSALMYTDSKVGSSDFQVPANIFSDGETYTWQVITQSDINHDGTYDINTVSDMWSFTIDNDRAATLGREPVYPRNGNSLVDKSSCVLQWTTEDVDGDPINSKVYIGTDINNVNMVYDGLGNTVSVINNLDYNKRYFWYVVVNDEIVGPMWSFSTLPENMVPIAAEPYPFNNQTEVSLEHRLLKWKTLDTEEDAVFCRVFLSDDVSKLNEPNSQIYAGYNMECIVNTLQYNKTYYWQLQMHDGHNTVRGPIWTFTTQVHNTPPVLSGLLPMDGSTNVNLNINTLYWIATDTFGETVHSSIYVGDDPNDLKLMNKSEDMMYTIQPVPGKIVYWKVIVEDGFSPPTHSEIYSFQYENIPDMVLTLLQPVDSDVQDIQNVTLTWSCTNTSYRNDVRYFVYFTKDLNNFDIIDSTPLTYFNLYDLENGETYHWKIEVRDEFGNSFFSTTRTFNTQDIGVPVYNIFPHTGSNNVDYNKVDLYLQEDIPNVSYDIYFGDSIHDLKVIESGVRNLPYTITGLNPSWTYYWRVKNSNGVFSSIYNFTTQVNQPPYIVSSSPNMNAVNVDFRNCVLSWNIHDDENDYTLVDLWLGAEGDELRRIVQNYNGTSFTLNSLRPDQTYFWKLYIRDKYSGLIEQPVRAFKTVQNHAPVVYDLHPVDGETNVEVFGGNVLSWETYDASGDDTFFDVKLGYDPDSLITVASWLYEKSLVPQESFDFGITYYWQVIAKDMYGKQSESPIHCFETEKVFNVIVDESEISLGKVKVSYHIFYSYTIIQNKNYLYYGEGVLNKEESIFMPIQQVNELEFNIDPISNNIYYFWLMFYDVLHNNRNVPVLYSEVFTIETSNDNVLKINPFTFDSITKKISWTVENVTNPVEYRIYYNTWGNAHSYFYKDSTSFTEYVLDLDDGDWFINVVAVDTLTGKRASTNSQCITIRKPIEILYPQANTMSLDYKHINVIWEVYDLEEEDARYDVYIRTNLFRDFELLYSNLKNKTCSLTGLTDSTEYCLKIVYKRYGVEYETSQHWFTTKPDVIPVCDQSSCIPIHDATNIPVQPDFIWSFISPDVDSLFYEITIGHNLTSINKEIVYNKGNIFHDSFKLEEIMLEEYTQYEWMVTARDAFGKHSSSLPNKFTTTYGQSYVTHGFPANNSNLDVSETDTLSWTVVKKGDIVFDLYLGESPDSLICIVSGLTKSFYKVSSLAVGKEYYWRVIIRDNINPNYYGPIWRFTVIKNIDSGFQLLKPSYGEVDVNPLTAKLLWDFSGPNMPDSFKVYYSELDKDDTVLNFDSMINHYDIPKLKSQTVYKWKIDAEFNDPSLDDVSSNYLVFHTDWGIKNVKCTDPDNTFNYGENIVLLWDPVVLNPEYRIVVSFTFNGQVTTKQYMTYLNTLTFKVDPPYYDNNQQTLYPELIVKVKVCLADDSDIHSDYLTIKVR